VEINITVDDAAVRDMLSRAHGRINYARRGGLEDGTALLLREAQTYPAPPPNSTYKRTNTLLRSWSRRVTGERGVVGSSGNIAPYNRRVMDRNEQAAIHVGRWSTAQDIAERNAATIQGFFDARIAAALR